MKSITIHSLDDVLAQKIAMLAEEKEMSLNRTIKMILSDALSTSGRKQQREQNFYDLCGVWSNEEKQKFDAYTNQEFGRVDPKDWE